MSDGLLNQLQSRWSSRWAFILATTGAAVGLGNIWRFPYMVGMHGGSAFVAVYCICVLMIGLPVMLAEILIGRLARRNPIDSLETLALAEGASSRWRYLGYWGAFGLILVLSFYSVVAGWALAYLWHAATVGFSGASEAEVAHLWQDFMASPGRMLFWHTIFMMMTVVVIVLGVKRGLERATRLLMPALYLMLFGLVGYACVHADFAKAWHFLFGFRWHDINADVVLSAMGHAFFTLAIGAGALLTYGAYVPERVNLVSSIGVVAFLDVLVALLSGLAIFPWVFHYGLLPQSGPGLMFEVLPSAFAQVAYGNGLACLFFCLLWFAAWTSSINIAEPLVVILIERYGWSRRRAAWSVGGMAWFVGIASVLSWNVWQSVLIWGHWSIFDAITGMATDWVLPIGGIGFAWFVGHVLAKETVASVLAGVSPRMALLWRWLLRYIAPIGIVLVFIEPAIKWLWHV